MAGGEGDATTKAGARLVKHSETMVDRYRIGDTIGSGGMGSVFRAFDEVLRRQVAIKVLKEEAAKDPNSRERFLREARIAAGLRHPGVCSVFDFQESDGSAFIVMELLDGETLHDRITRDGPLPPQLASEVAARAAEALHHAHGAGAVHRDVKSSNIFITDDGQMKLTDFGIAHATTHQTLTKVGDVLGTVAYVSPEQVAGRKATPASDIYSLGCVLHEALVGRPPFTSEVAVAVGRAHLDEDPPDLLAEGIPGPIASVVAKALRKDPSKRFSSGAEMAHALREAAAELPPPDLSPPSTPPPAAVFAAPDPTRNNPAVEERGTEELPIDEISAAISEPTHRPRGAAISLRSWAAMALGIGVLLIAALVALAFSQKEPTPPETATIPELTGLSYDDAAAQIKALGLLGARRTEELSSLPAGTVLRQDPAPGTEVRLDRIVELVVSDGSGVEVPDVRGMDKKEAKDLLEQAGLDAKEAAKAPGDEKDVVLDQDPPPGQVVPRGSEVRLTISTEDDDDEDSGPPGLRRKNDD